MTGKTTKEISRSSRLAASVAHSSRGFEFGATRRFFISGSIRPPDRPIIAGERLASHLRSTAQIFNASGPRPRVPREFARAQLKARVPGKGKKSSVGWLVGLIRSRVN